MKIDKIVRSEMIEQWEQDIDLPAQQVRVLLTLSHPTNEKLQLISTINVNFEVLHDAGVDPAEAKENRIVRALMEERVACDIAEFNHEGHWAAGPMSEEVHDIRLGLGLETIL